MDSIRSFLEQDGEDSSLRIEVLSLEEGEVLQGLLQQPNPIESIRDLAHQATDPHKRSHYWYIVARLMRREEDLSGAALAIDSSEAMLKDVGEEDPRTARRHCMNLSQLLWLAIQRRDVPEQERLLEQLESLGVVFPDEPTWMLHALEIYPVLARWDKVDAILERVFNGEITLAPRFRLEFIKYAIRAYASKNRARCHELLDLLTQDYMQEVIEEFGTRIDDRYRALYYEGPQQWMELEWLKTHPDITQSDYKDRRQALCDKVEGTSLEEAIIPELIARWGLSQEKKYDLPGRKNLWLTSLVHPEKAVQGELSIDLAPLHRDVFGHGKPVDNQGWGEYRGTEADSTSIEDAFGTDQYAYLGELESQNPDKMGDPEALFHRPSTLISEFQEQLQKPGIRAAFLVDVEGIKGFSYGWESTPQEIWNEKFEQFFAHTQFDQEQFFEALEAQGIARDQKLFYFAELGIVKPFRGNLQIVFDLVAEMAKDSDPDMPGIASTARGSHTDALFRGSGSVEICAPLSTESNLVILSGPTKGDILERFSLSPVEFLKRFGKNIRSILRASLASSEK